MNRDDEKVKLVYDILYASLPLYKKTIDEYEISFDQVVNVYNNLNPFSLSRVKVKLDGGAYQGRGIPCIFSGQSIDSIFKIKGNDAERKIVRERYRNFALAAVAVVLSVLVYVYSRETAYYQLSKHQVEEIKQAIGNERYENEINWNHLSDNMFTKNGYSYTLNGKSVNLTLQNLYEIRDGLRDEPFLTYRKINNLVQDTLVFVTSWNKFFKEPTTTFLTKTLAERFPNVFHNSMFFFTPYVFLNIIQTYLLSTLQYLGLCTRDAAQLASPVQQVINVNVALTGDEEGVDISRDESKSIISVRRRNSMNVERSKRQQLLLQNKSPTRSIPQSLQTPLSLQYTPPRTPERPKRKQNSISSPRSSSSLSLRRRRPIPLSAELKLTDSEDSDQETVAYPLEAGKKRSRSKPRSRTKKEILKLLVSLYKPKQVRQVIPGPMRLLGGARKGTFLCTIQAWGATLLFLTLVVFFFQTYGKSVSLVQVQLAVTRFINSWLPEKTWLFPKLNVLHQDSETGGGYAGLYKILVRQAFLKGEFLYATNKQAYFIVYTTASATIYTTMVFIFKFILLLLKNGPEVVRTSFVKLNDIFANILCDNPQEIEKNISQDEQILVQLQTLLDKRLQ
jgi:hypothetical protein